MAWNTTPATRHSGVSKSKHREPFVKIDGLIVDITDEDFAGDLGLKVILRGQSGAFRRLLDLLLASKPLVLEATESSGTLEILAGARALEFRAIAPKQLRFSMTAGAARDFYAMVQRFAHPSQHGGHYFVDAEALGAALNEEGFFEGDDFEIILDQTPN